MRDTLFLARKYALAFDSCAKDTQEAKQNLLCYQKALKNIVQIEDIIKNPAIPFTAKKPLLKKVLGQDIGAAFISLLIEKKRFSLASLIEKEILLLLDKRQGLSRARVITALQVSKEEKQKIRQVLINYFKSDLDLSFTEDKNILGGMIIKKEDLCIDGSILGQLTKLEQALKR